MIPVADLLRALDGSGDFEAVDLQLAEVLTRRSSAAGDASALATAVALASRAVREGHSAMSLDAIARQAAALPDAATGGERRDAVGWWARALSSSAAVGRGAGAEPLVLGDGLFQFRRYRDAESRIAAYVHGAVDRGGRRPAFRIITGGPGTGKTTKVAQLLGEMVQQDPQLRVALAAPTGKAAARVSETIRQRLASVDADDSARARLPSEAMTIHRLLAYRPWKDTFDRNEENPLGEDLVVVDEASMVDVLVMDALLKALKPGAELILVGDHNQLASVDAGDVLGALCRAALAAPVESPLYQSVDRLTRSWRFEAHPDIGALAGAVLSGDAPAVLATCAEASRTDISLQPPPASTDALLVPLLPHLDACLRAGSPAALLEAMGRFRVLAPERAGRLGVAGINLAIEGWLARQGQPVHDRWYHGRPVLVTANDYATGIFNGDIGVVWRDASGVTVHFPVEGGTRAVAPPALPHVETAWAMTVHKSQGSEFDTVLVVLPEHESRVLSRELLYTAVTRARREVAIFASEDTVRFTVSRSAERTSGLAARLREGGEDA